MPRPPAPKRDKLTVYLDPETRFRSYAYCLKVKKLSFNKLVNILLGAIVMTDPEHLPVILEFVSRFKKLKQQQITEIKEALDLE